MKGCERGRFVTCHAVLKVTYISYSAERLYVSCQNCIQAETTIILHCSLKVSKIGQLIFECLADYYFL